MEEIKSLRKRLRNIDGEREHIKEELQKKKDDYRKDLKNELERDWFFKNGLMRDYYNVTSYKVMETNDNGNITCSLIEVTLGDGKRATIKTEGIRKPTYMCWMGADTWRCEREMQPPLLVKFVDAVFVNQQKAYKALKEVYKFDVPGGDHSSSDSSSEDE